MKCILPMLIVLFVCNPAFSQQYIKELNLNTPDQEIYVHSTENANIFQDPFYRYWTGLEPSQESQVTYRFKFPEGTRGQVGFLQATFDTRLIVENPDAYFVIEASPDNSSWKTYNSYFYGQSSLNNSPKLITESILNQHEVFVRARFKTTFAHYLPTGEGSTPALSLRVILVPEPSSILLLLAGIVFTKPRRA